jgi:hypothetical protein
VTPQTETRSPDTLSRYRRGASRPAQPQFFQIGRKRSDQKQPCSVTVAVLICLRGSDPELSDKRKHSHRDVLLLLSSATKQVTVCATLRHVPLLVTGTGNKGIFVISRRHE